MYLKNSLILTLFFVLSCQPVEIIKPIEIDTSKLDKISMEYTHRKVPGFPLEQLFIMDPDGVKVELNYATS